MSSPVYLYVYDLSNGLAKQLSLALTGKQIDGIWHTSVVVFGKEIFYGQGISTVSPGQSHHGKPLQIINMGETSLDKETFDEYLQEMREHYTADKYHLLEFNCNSFTNDCVGFLVGRSIPSWISDLPSDFLSTPFGAALRPTIDSMFRQPAPGVATPPPSVTPASAANAAAASPNPALASALLQAVAQRAFNESASSTAPNAAYGQSSTSAQRRPPNLDVESVASPIHICTNNASFQHILQTHRAVVAFFTSATCGPCRMIEPVFERIAGERTQAAGAGGRGIAFVKIDTGMASAVASQYGIRVTPTFVFFQDSKKTHEMKGVNAPELESQVKFLLWETYPPHPHTKNSIPALESLSTDPILFKQVPALDAVLSKLTSFINLSTLSVNSSSTQGITQILSTSFVPCLKSRFPPPDSKGSAKPILATTEVMAKWGDVTKTLVTALPVGQLFPLVDMWRLAVLDEAVGSWCAAQMSSVQAPGGHDPLSPILLKAIASLSASDVQEKDRRNLLLTSLRLLTNAVSLPSLSSILLSSLGKRKLLTALLVSTLLHSDSGVRTAAASLAFNVSASVQKVRLEAVRKQYGPFAGPDEDGEWEVEVLSALLEAISNEQNDDIVHRLVASLAFLLRFSPVYDTHLSPLLEVLQAKDILRTKLQGEGIVKKPEVQKLLEGVAERLC